MFFRSFSRQFCIVDVSSLGQRPVHRLPATGRGVLATQTQGQATRLVIAYLVHERAQARLRGAIAHHDADDNGQKDDKDHGRHDSPAQRHHSPFTTNL